jgi:hypothetical protein
MYKKMDFFYIYNASGVMEKIYVEGFVNSSPPPPKPPLPLLKIKTVDDELNKIVTETDKMRASISTASHIINTGLDNMNKVLKTASARMKSFEDRYEAINQDRGFADYTENIKNFLEEKKRVKNEIISTFANTEESIRNAKKEVEKLNVSFGAVGTFAEDFVMFCNNIDKYSRIDQNNEIIYVDHDNFKNPVVNIQGVKGKSLYDKAKDSAAVIKEAKSKVPDILKDISNFEKEYNTGNTEITKILKDPPKPPLPEIKIKSVDTLLDKITIESDKMKASIEVIPQIIDIGYENMKNMRDIVSSNIKSFEEGYANIKADKGSSDYNKNMTDFLKAKNDFRNEILANFKKTEESIANCSNEIEKLKASFLIVGNFAESFIFFCDNIHMFEPIDQGDDPEYVDHDNFRDPAIFIEGIDNKGLYDKAKDSSTKISMVKGKIPSTVQMIITLVNDYISGTTGIINMLRDNYSL